MHKIHPFTCTCIYLFCVIMYEGCGYDLSNKEKVHNSIEPEEGEGVLVLFEKHVVV